MSNVINALKNPVAPTGRDLRLRRTSPLRSDKQRGMRSLSIFMKSMQFAVHAHRYVCGFYSPPD